MARGPLAGLRVLESSLLGPGAMPTETRARATVRASALSSNSASRKPIEKVFTGPPDRRDISATTLLESTPPERNAPSGTSLTRCDRTASSSTSCSCARASSSDPAKLSVAGISQ